MASMPVEQFMRFNPKCTCQKSSENAVCLSHLLHTFLILYDYASIRADSVNLDQTAPPGPGFTLFDQETPQHFST